MKYLSQTRLAYLNKKGFIFTDILISIFIIGLAIFTLLPLLKDNLEASEVSKSYLEMNYLGEYIFERLNSQDKYVIESLNSPEKEIEFKDIGSDYIDKYKCRLVKLGAEEDLWEVKVIIKPRNHRRGKDYVEFYGSIPKP